MSAFADVREGPDGALWLLTDNDGGRILRVVLGAIDALGLLGWWRKRKQLMSA
jgi:hypothetical protein